MINIYNAIVVTFLILMNTLSQQVSYMEEMKTKIQYNRGVQGIMIVYTLVLVLLQLTSTGALTAVNSGQTVHSRIYLNNTLPVMGHARDVLLNMDSVNTHYLPYDLIHNIKRLNIVNGQKQSWWLTSAIV